MPAPHAPGRGPDRLLADRSRLCSLLRADQLAGSSPVRRLLAKLLVGQGRGEEPGQAAGRRPRRAPPVVGALQHYWRPLAAHRDSRLVRALSESGRLPVMLTARQLPWQPR
jgi:hypothetical protein